MVETFLIHQQRALSSKRSMVLLSRYKNYLSVKLHLNFRHPFHTGKSAMFNWHQLINCQTRNYWVRQLTFAFAINIVFAKSKVLHIPVFAESLIKNGHQGLVNVKSNEPVFPKSTTSQICLTFSAHRNSETIAIPSPLPRYGSVSIYIYRPRI